MTIAAVNFGSIAETKEMLDFCGKHGITADVEVIRIQDIDKAFERMSRNDVTYDLIQKVAARKHATPAQIALAWLLTQKPWIVPIPGTRKIERLDENLGAARVELTRQDFLEIEVVAAQIQVQGTRLPQAALELSGR